MSLSAAVVAEPTVTDQTCGLTTPIRFATFNVFLNRPEQGELQRDLGNSDTQARKVAEIIAHIRPDVLLLNEFDFDPSGNTLSLFADEYLAKVAKPFRPIQYPYRYLAPSNTGIAAPIDVNGDGVIKGPSDAYGYGSFPGQYAMALLSRYPIESHQVRTFQNFLWRDMPRAEIPQNFYTDQELEIFRLSSKSHWDIPIRVDELLIHALAAHPTPAVFDGVEDHNGRRNHDEIRLWADYIDGAGYLYDDRGRTGGLARNERFVIVGDYNADPVDGDSRNNAINQLLNHALVDASQPPNSAGAVVAAKLDKLDRPHKGDPATDTSDFSQNLRIDYVLPSHWGLDIEQTGVFWPTPDDPLYDLVGDGDPIQSSDHRLVWADLRPTQCTKDD